ncbi:T6SS effector BTH_I2691 family protein [Xenorhabdus szentirmaii]|uniref:Toxin VasX N-terminal region domain-containing protein n=1 Tax=Xenorhabdus szentirmaii DSM 16338 TaxID=1427518 RepID=W1J7N7_9GAMM|nr:MULTISPECIES: T6SS effector BTH_I2691 family protein [Xenorhabdus]MBD2822834.1 hypothetical protein [Xenorhabdus sp. 42]PHM31430.1 hypothetical protein Xsze_02125 [Xenorhabdus szentirmaii DSM 16338]CDL85490.1 conserved membrane hypothetical protein [Xenorhabdus szentirmaii DSM 16338]
MYTELGCGFCQREGLPVFLARPAIMSKSDDLPELNIRHRAKLPVGQVDEARYTARILREGFLYVYTEKSNLWQTYTVNSKGHYYLQPESGKHSECLESEKKTLCMKNESKVAKASFITLHIGKKEEKNGIVWFAWSDAPWSEDMKKQHEDKKHRVKNMQRFDVDAWLKEELDKNDNVGFLSELQNTVIEYNDKFSKEIIERECSLIKTKTFDSINKVLGGLDSYYVFFKDKNREKANNIINEANQLHPKKGVILLLSDPVGIIKDISFLCNYLFNENFTNNPNYSREVELSSMLSGLKEIVCNQYRKECQEHDVWLEESYDRGAKSRNYFGTIDVEYEKNKYTDKHIKSLNKRVEDFWNEKYEKYIDRKKEKDFLEKYQRDTSSYIEKTLSPIIDMYLNWLKNDILKSKLMYDYDSNNEICSLLYVQAVNDCIDGMADQDKVIKYIVDQLKQEKITEDNFILRAMFLNNDSFINKTNDAIDESNKAVNNSNKEVNAYNKAVGNSYNYASLPWNKIFDGAADSIAKFDDVANKLELYLNNINGALFRVVNIGINNAPLPAIIAMAATNGKEVMQIIFEGKQKECIKVVTEELAKTLDVKNKKISTSLSQVVGREMRKLKLIGVKMDVDVRRKFLVMVDRKEAEKIKELLKTNKEIKEAKKVIKRIEYIITSEKELRNYVFNGEARKKLAEAKAKYEEKSKNFKDKYNSKSVQNKLNKTQFSGCIASLIFQGSALYMAWGDAGKDSENILKYLANIVGAAGTLFDTISRSLAKFKDHKYVARLGSEEKIIKYARRFSITSRVFAVAGYVAAVSDFCYGFNELFLKKDGDILLGGAYIISAVFGGALVTFSIGWLALGPVGIIIVTAIFFGSAIYINSNEKNDIQRWLLSCLWRNIPMEEKNTPAIWANQKMEMDEYKRLLS